jgi:oligoribonuclease
LAAVPAASDADERLVWIDLEMTGLDVERDAIVEIACVVTDNELTVIDDGIDIVVHQPPERLAAMDKVVREMHTRSGLLAEIEASTTELGEAGARVLEYVRAHVSSPGTVPLCGNTIGMDRRFLARHLPDLDAYLHYRSVDVSALKELCRRWYPEEYRHRPAKTEQHRALGDILESVRELQYYRDTILKPRG